MKKLVVLLTLVATASAFSQGQVIFTTKNATVGLVVNARVSYHGGPVPEGAFPTPDTRSNAFWVTDGNLQFGGPNARIALYAVNGETTDASTLKIISPNVPFRTGNVSGYSDGTYPNGTGSTTREVPNNTPGQMATFQVRAWDTGLATDYNTYDYEKAVADITAAGKGYYGVGNLFSMTTGGGTIQAPYLQPATAFTINWVPEPSIIGLGILGAIAGMVVFRRRQ